MLDEDPSQGGYYAMGCYESKGAMIWSSRAAVSGGGGGINNEQCPRQAVEANASCADHVGQLCWYPEGQCLCDADSTTWVCDTTATQYLPRPPRQIKRLCVDFDESKLVKDLTEQEARDWCKWSVTYNNNNTPNLELLAPTPPPYDSRNYGVTFGDLGGEVCRPVLPIDACAANLKVAPDCDATLGELSECAETISAQNTRVGRGCEALLQNASCAGVFALRVPNGAACPLPFP
jgi:hypothetical protein